MKRLLSLMLVLALAACSKAPSEPVAPAAPAEPAAQVAAPAAEPVAEPAAEPAAEGETAADAPAGTAPVAEGETPAPAAPEAPAPAMPDPANAPREGIDYVVLAEPQPTMGQGGIEVAEIFAYTCIHCANLQPAVDQWKPNLPSDVRFLYVPGAFGGVSDNLARAYYAAEAMGILEKSHSPTFNAFFVERKFSTLSPEELAAHYAGYGVDEAAFLSTMQSFSVTAKVNRARQFALRTGVTATPSVIINGKYLASMTGDRGPDGLLKTIDWLVAKERATAAQ